MRFALHGQGQNCPVWTRWRATAYRGLGRKTHSRFGDLLPQVNVRASTGRAKGFLTARDDRVPALGVST